MRRFLTYIVPIIGLWALVSFIGVMVDPTRANLWTQSLMWSLISSALVAPSFIFLRSRKKSSTASNTPSVEHAGDTSAATSRSASDFQKEFASSTDQTQKDEEAEQPFDDSNGRSLWPESSDEKATAQTT